MPPIDVPSVEQATQELTESDLIEKMGETETSEVPETVVIPDETESETKETEEDDEKIEVEEEDDEEEEQTDEYVSPVPRKAILAKYPNLFKDFPYLQTAYYRSQQYTEVFPTIEDAKEAHQSARMLKNFEQDLMSGSVGGVLKSIKEGDGKTFNKVVDNYLKDLYDADSTAYHHVSGNLIRTLTMNMVKEAQTSGNDALKAAAVLVNQFMFGDSNFKPPTRLSGDDSRPDSKEQELRQREMEFNQRQYNTALNGVREKITNKLKTAIDDNIDKSGSMSSYVKKNASKECLDMVHGLIKQDKQFDGYLNRLWREAYNQGFSEPSLSQIRKAYINKAQGLLPSALKKVRQEALGSGGGKVKNVTPQNRTPIRPGRTASPAKPSGPKTLPKGMSMMDFLTSD